MSIYVEGSLVRGSKIYDELEIKAGHPQGALTIPTKSLGLPASGACARQVYAFE
jgi:hypothetical protein